MKTLEILLSYQCNSGCVYCFLPAHQRSGVMESGEAARLMRWGMENGAVNLYFSGGEPTLRKELARYVKAAKGFGYGRVVVRTNGMMLSYPEYLDGLIDAGVDGFCVSVKSHEGSVHDELSRVPGGFGLVTRGIGNVVERGMDLECDYLVHARNCDVLSDGARYFYDMGVRRFNFQYLSTYYNPGGELSGLLISMERAGLTIGNACAWLEANGAAARAYYIAPCFLSPNEKYFYDLKREQLVVADVNGMTFALETTPMQGKIKVAACAKCALNSECPGLREDYLEIFGDGGVKPVRGKTKIKK